MCFFLQRLIQKTRDDFPPFLSLSIMCRGGAVWWDQPWDRRQVTSLASLPLSV